MSLKMSIRDVFIRYTGMDPDMILELSTDNISKKILKIPNPYERLKQTYNAIGIDIPIDRKIFDRKTIAFDFDDVIIDAHIEFARYNKLIPCDDYNESDDYAACLGLSDSEFIRMWGNFYKPENFKVMNGALEGLTSLANSYRLIIITYSPPSTLIDNYITTTFPGIFERIIHSYTPDLFRIPKSFHCNRNNASWLVDDTYINCEDIIKNSDSTIPILFGQYPWNVKYKNNLNKRVIQCDDWKSLLEYFKL